MLKQAMGCHKTKESTIKQISPTHLSDIDFILSHYLLIHLFILIFGLLFYQSNLNMHTNFVDYFFIFRSSDPIELAFELFKAGAKGAIKEICACEDLKAAKNGWINLISDFEADIGLILLVGCNNLFSFFLGKLFGRDDTNVFLFVEDLAVRNIGLNDLLQVGQPATLDDGRKEVIGQSVIVRSQGVKNLLLLNSLDG